jgi:pyruvate dehydrogenase E1 component
MVADWTDDQIWSLKRGGHDYRKLYAAYAEALSHKGKPTVILAKTVKGYGLGKSFEGRNAVHQMKKLSFEVLKSFRDDLRIPISDAQLKADPYRPPYYHPGPDDPAIQYLLNKRRELGGALPQRRHQTAPITLPGNKLYELTKKGSGKQDVATTMAFARLFKDLLKDENIGKRFVPIIPDEARTFGMDSYFPTSKIYNPFGQNYASVDRDLLLAYKESVQGQILHTGINEAGSMAAFVAAGTSYATQGEVMIPVYVLYSMFGFQRTGDQMWLAGDQMARGFVIGATAGKTTLAGEGLQHADGHSHLIASANDAVIAYDPAFAFEIGHIVKAGLDRMYGGTHSDPNVYYYLTVYNEPMIQPAEPSGIDIDGLLRGMYKYRAAAKGSIPAQILASGVSVPWALEAQKLLASDWNVAADVWSVTSWNELRRDGRDSDRFNFLHPSELPRVPYVTEKLRNERGPVIAVSDFMHAVADQIRPYVPTDFATLGGDGFGFSDTRAAARRHFAIDTESIVVRVLQQLAQRGEVDRAVVIEAFQRYRLDDVTAGTTGNTGGDA